MKQETDVPAPIDFPTFLLSFHHMALVHLDGLEEAGTGGVDLVQAKHYIDILHMLSDKTKGNLKTEEEKFLKSILFDLRMKYVEKCKESSDGMCE